MKRGDLVSFCIDGRCDLHGPRHVLGMILQTHGDRVYPVGPPYDEDISFDDRYLVWWFNIDRIRKLNMNPRHLESLNETR